MSRTAAKIIPLSRHHPRVGRRAKDLLCEGTEDRGVMVWAFIKGYATQGNSGTCGIWQLVMNWLLELVC